VACQVPASSLIGKGPSLVRASASSSLSQENESEIKESKKTYVNVFIATNLERREYFSFKLYQ
jgi:hypothetical protein